MYKASDFHSAEALKSIPDNKPGYYKVWASEKDLDFLLNSLGITDSNIKKQIEHKDGLWCIYIGIAAKESIRSRINWHLNDSHTESRVKSGILSTFRQSISSLVAHDQYDKAATDSFINNLQFEYFTLDTEIGSEETISSLHVIEKKFFKDQLCILNIQDNYFPSAKEIKGKLKDLRKEAKIRK